jgi:ketosteroid isomerase-like protein
MSEEDVELVRRAFEQFAAGMAHGDPTAMFDSGVVATDLEWRLPSGFAGLRTVYRGREGFAEFIRTWTEDFEWSIELETIIDAGAGRVVLITRQRATGTGSGAPVELQMAAIHDVADGRLVRATHFLTPAEALQAAGVSEQG